MRENLDRDIERELREKRKSGRERGGGGGGRERVLDRDRHTLREQIDRYLKTKGQF